jgi:hypothetical protein
VKRSSMAQRHKVAELLGFDDFDELRVMAEIGRAVWDRRAAELEAERARAYEWRAYVRAGEFMDVTAFAPQRPGEVHP